MEWTSDGSKEEDAPLCRAANHFHNPLLPWTDSKVTDFLLQNTWCAVGGWSPLYSNVTWATGYKNPPQDNGKPTDETFPNSWDPYLNTPAPNNWNSARTYYYKALTGSLDDVRQTNFAKTFQAVGQVMHLLQDMAVPAHVRNDFTSHLKFTGINTSNLFSPSKWVHNSFEYYVQNHPGVVAGATITPTFIDIHLTDFWDTGKYRASQNPALTLVNSGLAEYTNANFVSDSTFSTQLNPVSSAHYFYYPNSVTSAVQEPVTINDPANPEATTIRLYYRKTNDGEIGHLLAGVGYLEFMAEALSPYNPGELLPYTDKISPMDDYVHRDYAQKLLPRAVGYSAALLDYFFRGTIELSLPDTGVYAIADQNGIFSKIQIKAKNTTQNAELMENGTLQLVVKYRIARTDPMAAPYPMRTPDFTYTIVPEMNNVTALSTSASTTLTFDVSANPIPLWATDLSLQVVYKGQLGNEADAIAVGFKDISEPTPMAIINNTDYTCVNGVYMKSGTPEIIQAVDVNGNDAPDDWDIFPHFIEPDYLAFTPGAVASTSNYIATFPTITAGQYGHVYLLTDYHYAFSDRMMVKRLDTRDWFLTSWPAGPYGVSGFSNQDEYINGTLTYHTAVTSTVRGLKIWNRMLLDNPEYPAGSTCVFTDAMEPLTGPVPIVLRQ